MPTNQDATWSPGVLGTSHSCSILTSWPLEDTGSYWHSAVPRSSLRLQEFSKEYREGREPDLWELWGKAANPAELKVEKFKKF